MSDIQKLLTAIADQLGRPLTIAPVELMVMKLRTMVSMMNAVSSYHHTETALAAFGEKEEEDA